MNLKSFFLSIIVSLLVVGKSMAVPAYPFPVKYTQPDGSVITLIGHGDERLSFLTTEDGYTIVKHTDGFYRYAEKVGGELLSSKVVAHDKASRSAAELAYLSGVKKYIKPEATVESNTDVEATANSSRKVVQKLPTNFNLGKFRGLVILVNYNDQKFRLGDDAHGVFHKIFNQDNFKGFQDPVLGWQEYTGSLHDYFKDNSMGNFAPEFDVVGPVDINYSKYYVKKNSNLGVIAQEALKQASFLTDFSKYDADDDGKVDMFYLVFAGYGSNIGGNDARLLWPCASTMTSSFRQQNMRFGRFACSTEITGVEDAGSLIIDGIGVMAHEFSHVLGFADHYDVNYNGYDSPGTWDVMAGGPYFNNSRTPVGYSVYERLSAGFINPEILNDKIGNTYTLNPLQENNEGYRIESGQMREFFLLENRQNTKWDKYLPGHGMLVWRVDSTSTYPYSGNTVNATKHPYLQIIRANSVRSYMEEEPSTGDAFPGSAGIQALANNSYPSNFLSYAGKPTDCSLRNITETDGVISFTIGKPDMDVAVETFNLIPTFEDNKSDVEGDLTKWDFTNTYVTVWNAPGSSTFANHAVAFTRKSMTGNKIVSHDLGEKPVDAIIYSLYNTSSSRATIKTIVEDASGNKLATQTNYVNADESSIIRVSANEPFPVGSKLTVNLTAGSKEDPVYLDNINLYLHESDPSAIDNAPIIQNHNTSVKQTYNLAGQKVGADYKGIVIRNGKKILVK